MQQIQRFQPTPKLDKVKIEWSQLEDIDLPVKWLDMTTNRLTQRAGSLYHKMELTYIQKPLADPGRPWIWKRGTLAFWAQMEIRLQQHLHRPQGDQGVMHHLEKLGWHI